MGRIGILGLGAMGAAIAARLMHEGVHPAVFGENPESLRLLREAGCEVAESAAALAETVDMIAFVPSDDAVLDRLVNGDDGLMAGARRREGPSLLVALHTVMLPREAARWAKVLATASVSMADAPLTGDVETAWAGDLATVVGGPDEIVTELRPFLDAYTGLVVHAGELGAGMACSLAERLVTYGEWMVVAEATRLARAAGVDGSVLAQLLDHTDAHVGAHGGLTSWPSIRDSLSRAPVGHRELAMVTEMAERVGFDPKLPHLADQRLDSAIDLARSLI